MRVEISRDKLGAYIYNAISLLEDEGWSLEKIEQEVGISHDEYNSIAENSFTIELTDEERFAIAREVEREDKISDIVTRIEELEEAESSCLNGSSASEIIEDQRLINEILRRWEKAEGWVDNSDYWHLVDDCIYDVIIHRNQII